MISFKEITQIILYKTTTFKVIINISIKVDKIQSDPYFSSFCGGEKSNKLKVIDQTKLKPNSKQTILIFKIIQTAEVVIDVSSNNVENKKLLCIEIKMNYCCWVVTHEL